MAEQSEKILQFGSGRFLRAFVDLFVEQANRDGQAVGQIVIVQSTSPETAETLNAQHGRYHVLIRGIEAGSPVDRVEEVTSISRALYAGTQWDAVLELARSPELKYIISNTTESGYQLEAGDGPHTVPPESFPAKLLEVLRVRFEAGQSGVVIMPCELIEGNAEKLRQIVYDLACAWGLSKDLISWILRDCVWLHTLVDRIVVAGPKDHPLAKTDQLLILAEPFAFFALEEHPQAPFVQHPAITRTPNVEPYFLRKVRILNAAHTALVIKTKSKKYTIVREAVQDKELRAWLERLLNEEIVPTLEGRVEGPAEFARQTIERFLNPYHEHLLADIAKHHEQKVRVRLIPTASEFEAKFGKKPPLLTELIQESGVRPEA